MVSQGVGVSVGVNRVVVGMDGRCQRVPFGGGGNDASQSNGNQEKDLKAN